VEGFSVLKKSAPSRKCPRIGLQKLQKAPNTVCKGPILGSKWAWREFFNTLEYSTKFAGTAF
jgi:hypothetical protein